MGVIRCDKHGTQFAIGSCTAVAAAVESGTICEPTVVFDRFVAPWVLCTECAARFDSDNDDAYGLGSEIVPLCDSCVEDWLRSTEGVCLSDLIARFAGPENEAAPEE